MTPIARTMLLRRVAALIALFAPLTSCRSSAIGDLACEYPIADLSKCVKRTPRAGQGPSVTDPPCGKDQLKMPGGVPAPQGFGKASFKPACEAHDICYSTCHSVSSVREQCEVEFLSALKKSCFDAYSNGLGNWALQNACLAQARFYSSITRGGQGRKSYDAAQKVVCECCVRCAAPQVECSSNGEFICVPEGSVCCGPYPGYCSPPSTCVTGAGGGPRCEIP